MKYRALVLRALTAVSVAAALLVAGVAVRLALVSQFPATLGGWAPVLGTLPWPLGIGWMALLRRDGRRRSTPLMPAVFALGSAAAALWLGVVDSSIVAALFVLALLNVSATYSRVLGVTLNAAGTAATAVGLWLAGNPTACALAAMAGAAACVLGFWLRLEFDEWAHQAAMFDQARWAASEFVVVNTRMQDNLDRAAGTTRMRERVRVAREIHDSVGYTLTALLVQLHAAQEVLRANPEALMPRLVQLEDMVRTSIQEVRKEVSYLRDESVVARSGKLRWERLCEVFADSTGIRVHTSIPEDLGEVNTEISEAVYRIIQEALTNAYRHGGADYVDVSMSWESPSQTILLRISDNGRGAADVDPGNGLAGMRERVGMVGGALAWQTEPGRGFDLGVEVPWKGSSDG